MARRLGVEADGPDAFVSVDRADAGHVFGGWLLAQALRAATTTVPDPRQVRAVHAAFVAAGVPEQHVHHHVERVRDGGSFSTRRVTTSQHGSAVLGLTAEFHAPEAGAVFERPLGAEVPGPDGLGPGRYDNPYVECRDVPVEAVAGGPPHARFAWCRVRGPLPPADVDQALHRQTLAYLSDFGATRAVREPHAHLADDARRLSVSLDHSIWFHRDVDASDWLLSELAPVATGGGRGLAIGHVRTADGALVATVAQEALLRER